MRISTVQMQDRGVTAMLDRQAELSKTQQQIATGRRILTASDDVLGTTQILAFNEVIDTYNQYQENAGVAEYRNELEEISLTQSIEMLQRARELAVQAENPTLGPVERGYLAVEVREILDALVSVANSVNSNGDYIFAGFNVDTAPVVVAEVPPASGLFTYSYTGDLGQRNVQIGATRFIATGDNGQDVFMNISVSGGGTQNIFETLEQFAIALETNAPTTAVPADLSLAMENLGSFRTLTGARLNAIDSSRALNEEVIFQGEKSLSNVEDLDYAEAIARFNLQITGLEASQKSFERIQSLFLFNFL